MTELVKQLAELWAGHGAWALVTAMVSIVIATLISKFLDQRWKHVYDRKMEELKTRLEQDRLAINAALSSLNAASAASHPKILEAVETLWDAILRLKGAFPAVSLYADILTKEEWCNLPSDSRIRDKMSDFSDREVERFVSQELADAEHARPFVGESIWSLYFVYRAFLLRIVMIVQRNFETGRLPYWYEDSGIKKFTRLLLTEEEIRAIERNPGARFGQVQQLAEGKILAEMNRIIAGHRSADSGLEQAKKMLRAVAEIEAGK